MLREAEAASTVIKLSIATADRGKSEARESLMRDVVEGFLGLEGLHPARTAQTVNCAVKSTRSRPASPSARCGNRPRLPAPSPAGCH